MPKELSSPLTEDDKAWLRSWNRGDEIPGDDNEPVDAGAPLNDGSGDPADPFDGKEPPEDYNDWTKAQLQHELEHGRKLPKTGNVAELVARLVEDDENSNDD